MIRFFVRIYTREEEYTFTQKTETVIVGGVDHDVVKVQLRDITFTWKLKYVELK